MICQDRLGTSATENSTSGAQHGGSAVRIALTGAEHVFLAPHCTDNHFTKTGSGQTWENLSEKAFSGRRCLIRRTNRSFSTANCGTHSQTTGIEMSEKRRSSLSMINTIICQGRLGTHVTERWKIKRITVSRSNEQANCGGVLLRNASHRLR